MEERRMYLFRCDFSSCSESTEIWHVDLKNVPVGFFVFNKAEKYAKYYVKIHPNPSPPPLFLCLYPNNVGFRSLRAKTLCMCVFYAIGGGGGLSRTCLKSFLTEKESACQISADSEHIEKSQRNRYIHLSSTEPFNCMGPVT